MRLTTADLVDRLSDALPLTAALWDEPPRRVTMRGEAMHADGVEGHDSWLRLLDFGQVRVRAFVSDPPMTLVVGDASEALAYLSEGSSLMIDRLYGSVPLLGDLQAKVAAAFGISPEHVDLKMSMTAGGGGVFPHFDQYDSVQVQLAGEKTWWVSESPAVPRPMHAFAASTVPDEGLLAYCSQDALEAPQSLTEHHLRPGDVLTVPRGCWHKTVAGGMSTGLVLRLAPPVLAEYLADRFRADASLDPEWRRPVYHGADGRTGAWASSMFAQLIEWSFPRATKDDDRTVIPTRPAGT